jgi:integrase
MGAEDQFAPGYEQAQAEPRPLKTSRRVLKALPAHLAAMALFVVNTGCRDREVCGPRWEWEVKVPQLGTAVFIVPGQYVKNDEDRLIVLNEIAASVVETQRGKHTMHVFAYPALDHQHRGDATAPWPSRSSARRSRAWTGA